jgi:hypothetical protein
MPQSLERFFGDPTWWFSVVVVSLIVNLGGAYLKQLIDALLVARSAKRAKVARDERQRRDERVQKIRSSDRELTISIHRELTLKLTGIVVLVLAVLAFNLADDTGVLPGVVAKLFALMIMVLGLYCLRAAFKSWDEIRDATRDGSDTHIS